MLPWTRPPTCSSPVPRDKHVSNRQPCPVTSTWNKVLQDVRQGALKPWSCKPCALTQLSACARAMCREVTVFVCCPCTMRPTGHPRPKHKNCGSQLASGLGGQAQGRNQRVPDLSQAAVPGGSPNNNRAHSCGSSGQTHDVAGLELDSLVPDQHRALELQEAELVRAHHPDGAHKLVVEALRGGHEPEDVRPIGPLGV